MSTLIDSTVFLGMHHRKDAIRIACKNLIIRHLSEGILIPYHEIGQIDDLIWQYPSQTQQYYFPFMDLAQSSLNISRTGETNSAVDLFKKAEQEELKLVTSWNKIENKISYSLSSVEDGPASIVRNEKQSELKFKPEIEKLYQDSLRFRV